MEEEALIRIWILWILWIFAGSLWVMVLSVIFYKPVIKPIRKWFKRKREERLANLAKIVSDMIQEEIRITIDDGIGGILKSLADKVKEFKTSYTVIKDEIDSELKALKICIDVNFENILTMAEKDPERCVLCSRVIFVRKWIGAVVLPGSTNCKIDLQDHTDHMFDPIKICERCSQNDIRYLIPKYLDIIKERKAKKKR